MNRYATTRRKMDKSGLRVYATTYYPEILLENSDQFIVTKVGDRLDTLSFNYYGDTTLWWIIAKANGIKGKVALNPETILRIPGNISQIIEKFKNLNKQS
jgi:nucleoid-associated protein YgaU